MLGMTDLRPGVKIELDGDIFVVIDYQHVKPGKGGAFVRSKIKNMRTGQVLERTFKQGDSIKRPDFEEKEMQYLYKDDAGYHFMDTVTYEQTFLTEDQMGDRSRFLQENTNVRCLYHNNEVIDISLPIHVILEITETEPGLKGDTQGSATKPATLETGAVIQVPLFVNQGDKVKVDTRTGDYIERAK